MLDLKTILRQRAYSTLFAFSTALALTGAAHGQSFSVSGLVQDKTGTPIPGATVRLSQQMTNSELADRMEMIASGRTAKGLRGVRTGQTGAYVIEVPAIGFWSLEINAEGKAAVSHTLEPTDGNRDLGAIKLRKEQRVDVHIVDQKGRPLVGALVRVAVDRDVEDSESARPTSQAAFSNAQGVASLWLANGTEQVDVVADGMVPTVERAIPFDSLLDDLLDGSRSKVILLQAHPQSVRMEVDGKPLRDATVFQDRGRLAVGRTDEKGYVNLPVSPKATKENPQRMRVEGQGLYHPFDLVYAPPGKGNSVDRPAAKRELLATAVNIKTKVVAGRVVDASGKAVAGAFVWTTSPRTEPVLTDKAGRYQLVISSVYPDQDHKTWVQAAGSGFLRTWVEFGRHQRISVDRARMLLVTALGENGEPVEGVEVSLIDTVLLRRSNERQVHLTALTGQDGTGRLAPLKAGSQYQLRAYRPGFRRVQQMLPAANPASEPIRELELRLETGATHVGWVMDEQDSPVAAAKVTVDETPSGQMIRGSAVVRQPLVVVYTDSDGRFSLADLAANKVDLTVRAEGFAPARVIGLGLPQEGAEGGAVGETEVGTVTLVPGESISGQVVDEAGQPLDGVELSLSSEQGAARTGSSREEALSGEDGQFSFHDLAPAQYNLHAGGGVFAPVSKMVKLPLDEPVRIELRAGRSLKLRITNEHGALVERPWIGASESDGSFPSTHWNGGEGVLEGIFAKKFRLEVSDAKAGRIQVPVAMGEGEEVLVDAPGARWDGGILHLVLQRGASIAGTVTGPQGEAVTSASVSVSGRNGSSGVVQSHDGRYEIFGVVSGYVGVHVRASEFPHHRGSVQVEGPGVTTYDVVLEEGWTVEGTVRGPNGEPAAGAVVHLKDPEARYSVGGSGRVLTDETGAFRLEIVLPKSYRVVAEKHGYTRAVSADVIDVRGPVHGLELALSRGVRVFGHVRGASDGTLVGAQVNVSSGSDYFSRLVDSDGSYEFSNVPKGTAKLSLNMGDRDIPREKIIAISGEQDVEVDFVLGKLRIAGSVLRNGERLADAQIVVMGPEMSLQGVGRSDAFGDFTVEGLERGEVTIIAEIEPSLVHEEKLFLSGDEHVVIEISTAELRGRVTDPAGDPVSGAGVAVEAGAGLVGFANGGEVRGITDGAGEFVIELRTSRKGILTVRAEADGYSSVVSVWDADQPRFLEMRIEKGAPLKVRWRGESPGGSKFSFVDRDGRVVHQAYVSGLRPMIPDAPIGTWTVLAHYDLVVLSSTVTIRESASADSPNVVEFSRPPTGRLLILPKSDTAVQGLQFGRIRLKDASGKLVRWPIGVSLVDSYFAFLVDGFHPEIPVGTWGVELLSGDGEEVLFSGPLVVQNGVTTTLELP